MMGLRTLVPVVAVLGCAMLWTAAPAAAVTPVTWCGNDRATNNRVPDVDTGSPYNIHVIYAIPSDGVDRFGTFASPIATDISAMDGWWRSQDAARTPRFDLFAFPGCTTHFGDLDLGFARLPRPASAYAGLNLLQLSADLTAFAPPNVKNVVYYDGPTDDLNVCGTTGYLATRQGGQFGFAFVWLQSDCDVDVGTGQPDRRGRDTRAGSQPRRRAKGRRTSARRPMTATSATANPTCSTPSSPPARL